MTTRLLIAFALFAALFVVGVAASGNPALEQKVNDLADAIANAEGFYDPDTVPAKFHNPGDLGPGDAPGLPSQMKDGSNVVMFDTDAAGWTALKNKLRRILSGGSAEFPLSLTFAEVGSRYAGDAIDWTNNVTARLGVSPSTVLGDWVQA